MARVLILEAKTDGLYILALCGSYGWIKGLINPDFGPA